jgi:hypothetical protein
VLLAGISLAAFSLSSQLGMLHQVGWVIALPIAGAAYMLISGALGICIYNGMKGSRAADHGHEAVLDPQNRAQMRNRALLAVSASIAIGFGFAAAFVAHG